MFSYNDPEDGIPKNSVVLEAKCRIIDEKLIQLVATTVVASFTEKNFHKNVMDVIPTFIDDHAYT